MFWKKLKDPCSHRKIFSLAFFGTTKKQTMSGSNTTTNDPPSTPRDHFCAQLARAALFPLTVDWNGHHHRFFPALELLDQLRGKLLQSNPNQAVSKLYPKRVVVVKAIGSDQLQWNGQPDITDDARMEIIPDTLSVKCAECEGTQLAYLGHQNELVLCSNNVVQDKIPERLQQTDLPPRSLRKVEEALARELVKFTNTDAPPNTCESLAQLEVQAAQAAECYYGKSATETRRGSGIWFRRSRDRCIKNLAIREASRVYSKQEASECVDAVLKQIRGGSQ